MQGFGSSPLELIATQAMVAREIFCANFTYNISYLDGTATDIAANGTTAAQLQINSDSDFLVQSINFISFTAADTMEVDPDYTLLLVTAGSGRQLMNEAVHILNQCGNYAEDKVPAGLPMPFLLAMNSTLTCTIVNRSAVAVNRADLTFRGFKVFYHGRANRQGVFNLQ